MLSVNTHVHADHITGSGQIKKIIPTCRSVISEASQARADVKLKDADLIKFGKFQVEARSTPGHTFGKKYIQLVDVYISHFVIGF